MTERLADASALLAVLNEEEGHDAVGAAIIEGELKVSAVNLAEVAFKLAERGMPIEDVRETLASFSLDVIPFTKDLALVSAMLAPLAREHDLSLGDRAAIATAYRLELPVLTADHDWHNAAAAFTEIFGTDPGLIFIR